MRFAPAQQYRQNGNEQDIFHRIFGLTDLMVHEKQKTVAPSGAKVNPRTAAAGRVEHHIVGITAVDLNGDLFSLGKLSGC